ncbi:MAG: GNAT family N-acetyltransferase [Marinomonadaceae bacterium]
MYSSDNHRHCFLLKGSVPEVLSDFLKLCAHLATPLICAHDAIPFQQLAPLQTIPFRTATFKQAHQELGHTHDAILVDLTHGVSASALAILAGTVRGNGIFAIALPQGDWLSIVDQDLPRYLPWPYESKHIDSNFKRRLLKNLYSDMSPFTVIPSYSGSIKLKALPALATNTENVSLTEKQRLAQSYLFAQQARSYVLIAPRGRGKSTLLGDTLAKMLMAGKKVALTAPNQAAIMTLKARFDSLLKAENPAIELPFYAPDTLLAKQTHWDFLFIDEASSIPIPLLTALNQKADHCLFSTTDYGYEGAGKGFGIRFCRYLETQSTSNTPSVDQVKLQRLALSLPIRWGENDPLENWINDCFFLTPNNALASPLVDSNNIESISTYTPMKGQEWLTNPDLLSRTFQLLVSAHYQTSPDNLRWILDDPSVTTYLSLQGSYVNSVAIITEEGPLPDELSLAVLQGTRRPRGHLIPQSLLAHEGIENAGEYRYWRISRIATQAYEQHKGVASQLLDYIETVARAETATQKCDFLCTSFAATPDVVSFWLKNGFIPVRLGTAKDQASGCYSLMMVKPLNHHAQQQASLWHYAYLANLSINLTRDYPDIDTDLADLINGALLHSALVKQEVSQVTEHNDTVFEKDKKDLFLFAYHHRPYLTIRAQLTRLVNDKLNCHQLTTTSPHYSLLTTVISQPTNKIDFSLFGLNTKKQIEKALKLAVITLL